MGFGLVIGFIDLLQLITTSKDYAVTVLHLSQITIGHTRSSQSVAVFTSCCLVAASNDGRSPSFGFPDCPWPQLPASHSNSSQKLNPSDYLTFFFIIIIGVGLSPVGTAATSGLLYKPQMIDEGDCGAIGGMKIGRGNPN
jgi:hypothetical protein